MENDKLTQLKKRLDDVENERNALQTMLSNPDFLHIPGPWSVSVNEGSDLAYVTIGDTKVCMILNIANPHMYATAQLISYAPLLFDALRTLVKKSKIHNIDLASWDSTESLLELILINQHKKTLDKQ